MLHKIPHFLTFQFVVILISSISFGSGNPYCADIYSAKSIYAAEFIPNIQARLGGQQKQWQALINRIVDRPIEEQVMINKILWEAPARSYFARKANTIFGIEAIARTLDRVYAAKQFDLSRVKAWEHLSVSERRAILLNTFKTWWWEVDSHYVMGFSRWTDASYFLARALTEPMARGRIDHRLHELLGTATQTSFLSGLISNFRSEIRILKTIEFHPNRVDLLKNTLAHRLGYLIRVGRMHQLKGARAKLLDIQVIRTAVLLKMLDSQRVLSRNEIEAVVTSLGLPRSLLNNMRWGQLGLSLIPNIETLVGVVENIAITTAIAYVIGQYFLEDLNDDEIYRGSFNELIEIKPHASGY